MGYKRHTLWCVVVLRRLPCVEHDPIAGTARSAMSDIVVAVYGPFSHQYAHQRADFFNRVEVELADGSPAYRPVPNAPDFLHQERWDEHYAVVAPLNDVAW